MSYLKLPTMQIAVNGWNKHGFQIVTHLLYTILLLLIINPLGLLTLFKVKQNLECTSCHNSNFLITNLVYLELSGATQNYANYWISDE